MLGVKSIKIPNYHPAGESDDEDKYNYGFQEITKKKKQVVNFQPKIDYESIFHKEIAAGNLQGVQAAFRDGALLSVIDKVSGGGYNGLMTASTLANCDIVEYLLEIGANPNFNNAELFTPLMAVCFSFSCNDANLSRCAKLLIEKGANMNAVDSFCTTPLMYACKFGHVGVVAELLRKRVNLNMTDKQGWTALFWAVNKGKVITVKMLLKAGAKKKIKAKNGKTAYSLALSKKGMENILAVLNPKKFGTKVLASKKREGREDDGLAHWKKRLDCFVPAEPTTKYKGMKLNLFEFLTLTDEELITLGMQHFWNRKQTLMFIKYYHMQPWVKYKSANKATFFIKGASETECTSSREQKEVTVLTYTTLANRVLSLQNRLVIVQASAVFLQRQCDGEDMHDDPRMVQLMKMGLFGINDVVKELQNILIALERADKTLVYPADYVKPQSLDEAKPSHFLKKTVFACLGALALWKLKYLFKCPH